MMWVMKLKVNSEKQLMGRIAIKHKITISGYPLSYWKEKDHLCLIQCGFFFGDLDETKELVEDIKSQPEVIKFEHTKNFAIMVSKQPLYTEPVWNPHIIRPGPVVINHKEKKHTWNLACFDKELLMEVYEFAKKFLDAELLKLKKEKLTNVYINHIHPKLTDKQRKALEIAMNNGYYDFPKKINMEKLASIMGVSYATYQAHLKKAESKIVPEVYKEF